MHPAGEDVDRVDRCVVRDLATVAPVGDAANHDGVDVEPEAERNHPATVAPPARREQDGVPVLRVRRGRRSLGDGRQPIAALGLLHLAALRELRQRR